MNNLLVFGSGNSAKRLVRYIDNRKNKILCYLDNDAQKWGKRMFGKRICSPDLACRLKYDYIFVASCYWKQIREQLLALGVDKNKIRCPLAPVRIERFKKEYGEIYNIWGKINFYCKKWYLAEQFHPDWLGILVNPYFFSRKKLYEDIVRYSSCLYGTCMDFGCGTQPYKGLLHVDEYIGVEIETDDKREGIIYYDGHRLPFADERFDSIISSEVFEHIDNVEEILAELYRVLKDGGGNAAHGSFRVSEALLAF